VAPEQGFGGANPALKAKGYTAAMHSQPTPVPQPVDAGDCRGVDGVPPTEPRQRSGRGWGVGPPAAAGASRTTPQFNGVAVAPAAGGGGSGAESRYRGRSNSGVVCVRITSTMASLDH